MKKNTPSILLVIDHFGSGGAQRQIVAIANGLVSLGHNVHIIIYYPEYDHHRSFIDDRVVIHEVKKSGKLGVNVILTVVKLLFLYRFKSALAFLHTPALYLEIASLLSFRSTKIYYSERSSVELTQKGVMGFFKKALHKKCTHITSNSILQTDMLSSVYGVDDVSYVPNIMSDNLFEVPIKKEKYSGKAFIVLAHTAPFKNYRYVANSLIEYVKIYNKTPPPIHWYGEIYESSELTSVMYLLESHGLQDCLVFKGAVTNVIQLLENVFFLIHPSKYESSANAVAEALTTGTPVILGNISDHRTILNESRAGYLLNLEKPKELAERIHFCQSIPIDNYHELCANARRYALKTHKADAIITQYSELLTK